MRKILAQKFALKSEATVPQIVINGKYIGGFTDMVKKFEQGELKFD
jgi:glutaredoxin